MINLQPVESLLEKRIVVAFLLLAVVLAGFFLRFDNLAYWLSNKSQYFTSNGIPVAMGVDPYYYLDIADDLLKGKIEHRDAQRHYPVGTEKPTAVPMLSALLALVSFIAKQPLEWIAALLPPFLGILFVFPLFLLGRSLVMHAPVPWSGNQTVSAFEANLAGLAAALLAVCSPMYVVRSSIGTCDTDTLNVFFTTLCIYLSVGLYAADNSKRRVRLVVIWCFTALAFIWWWDQLILPPLLLAAGPMLLACFFRRKELKCQARTCLLLIGSFLLVLVLWKQSSLLQIGDQFSALFSYLFGVQRSSYFPQTGQLVQEQYNFTLSVLATNVAGNLSLYGLSLLGLVILAFVAKGKSSLLFPLIILHVLAFSAMRFSVFFAPLFGLGIAALVLFLLLALRKTKFLGLVAAVVVVSLACWPPVTRSQLYNAGPPLLAPVSYEGMMEVADKTPENSVVWSTWGHGHPLVYYAERSTIGDGMYHPAYLVYVINYPLAASNFRLAANWIRFYTVHGEMGLKQVFGHLAGDKENWPDGMRRISQLLGNGVDRSREMLMVEYKMQAAEVEKLLSSLFPAECPPVYLFLDYKTIGENWYQTGNWNLKKNAAPPLVTKIAVRSFSFTREQVSGETETGFFQASLRDGTLLTETGTTSLLKGIYIFGRNADFVGTYPGRGGGNNLYLTEEDANKAPLGVIADHHVSSTILMKLFFGRQFDQQYFRPAIVRLPFYLVCEVTGDTYSRGSE